MTMIELKTSLGTVWLRPDCVDAIDFNTATTSYVRCGGLDYPVSHEDGQKLLAAINDNSEPTETTPTQVRAIVSIECAESYSQSKQVHFKFWRCVMDNGDKVNIFDHPDAARNTFKIAEYQGWGHWQSMAVGEEQHFRLPIAVTVSHDGEWYSLVGMTHNNHYLNMSIQHESEGTLDASEDDIPFESEAATARDNLAAGLDFEDDDMTTEAE